MSYNRRGPTDALRAAERPCGAPVIETRHGSLDPAAIQVSSPTQRCPRAALLLCIALLPGCLYAPEEPRVTVACVGDVMLGRGVARACAKYGNEYPFQALGESLTKADITFGNLEAPLAVGPVRDPRVNAVYASPGMAPVLKQTGFDVMSLANNHAIDCGRGGLRQTLKALEQAGIIPVGAGKNAACAEAGAVLSSRGIRVGFAAYSGFPQATFVHDPQRPSIALLNTDRLRRTIPPLRRLCDVLVVAFHWGKEGVAETSDHERALAHLAMDLGADVVVGHHAHVRGEIEHRDGKLACYCLGNLVFDPESYGGNEGCILTCEFGKTGLVGASTTPVSVVNCQGRHAGRRRVVYSAP